MTVTLSSATLLTSFLVGILIYVVVATPMPLFLQQPQGQGRRCRRGLLIAPRGVGTMLAMLIAGRAMTYVDARLLAGIGAVLMAIASVPMMHLTVDIGSGSSSPAECCTESASAC
ncbi:MAG: hypothetical protein IPI06_16005 [Gammaproteobacteria bacterium]|nr:hypothetical protein [Gammaproteobacteria bacterium]